MTSDAPATQSDPAPEDPSAIGSSARLAAFDFDGTLTRRDTLVPFLAKAAGRARFARVTTRLGLQGSVGRVPIRDRDKMKELMIRDLLGGLPEAALRDLGAIYARDILGNLMNTALLERLQEHRARGDRVILVSASLVYYLDEVATELGLDGVIGVEPKVVDGFLQGELARPNVRAEQKAVRLAEWLADNGYASLPNHSIAGANEAASAAPQPTSIEIWAYGNSSGDHQLLQAADHATWLGSPRKRPEGAAQFDGAPLS